MNAAKPTRATRGGEPIAGSSTDALQQRSARASTIRTRRLTVAEQRRAAQTAAQRHAASRRLAHARREPEPRDATGFLRQGARA